MTDPCGNSVLIWQRLCALVVAASCLTWPSVSSAQVVDLSLHNTLFHEASSVGSQMTVINPSVGLSVTPAEWLSVNAGYEADIVSGASEPVKAGPLASPDVISQASVEDVRHVGSGGFSLRKDNTRLSVGGAYGQEKDYRSRSFSVVAVTDFLKRNTEIELGYARGFDQVCNNAFAASRHPTTRLRLDSSKGCFSSAEDRQLMAIDLDNFHAAWTQAWTPVLSTQVVASFQLQHGFLGNPYRGVVIGPAGQTAQENHPQNRARTAVALRAKYFVRPLKLALGIGVRGYRDTLGSDQSSLYSGG